jgi:hypothetical protein
MIIKLMSFSFHDDEADGGDVNIDDLYENKQRADMYRLELYNRLLARIHSRIKLTSRRSKTEQHCWFVVPEVMIGAPRFDHGDCVAYLIDKLQSNGFRVTYTHPNLMFISWQHWVPSYVRQEIKKKTGLVVDGLGNKVEKGGSQGGCSIIGKKGVSFADEISSDPNELLFQRTGEQVSKPKKDQREYKSVNSYRPTGNLGYTDDVLESLERKLR